MPVSAVYAAWRVCPALACLLDTRHARPAMRILLISRHYPPAVSGGARRPFLLANALRAFGAEVFVIAPSLPDGETGLAVPHPNRDPATGPATRKALKDQAREWLLWPDPDIRWARRAADAAIDAFRDPPDWVITTSPPESVHAAGAVLARRWSGVKWAADVRDHWLDNPHRRERMAAHRRIGEGMIARRWLARADLVTVVDRYIGAEMTTLGAKRVEVLEHFAPPQAAYEAAPAPDLNPDKLHLLHAGSIALSDPLADIQDILTPFKAAFRDNPALHLHFVGRLTDEERALAQASGSGDHVTIHGVASFEATLAFQRAADALVYVASSKANVPPSKIVEYRAAGKPIIACGPDGVWRSDDRVGDVDPARQMAAIKPGQAGSATFPLSFSDIAGTLLRHLGG